jgi:hypothetical protein
MGGPPTTYKEGTAMAWGILMTAVAMFGMFALVIHEASTYEEAPKEEMRESDDYPKAA